MKPRGIIKFPVELGDGDNYVSQDIEFLVVDCWSPYNAILGKTTQAAFEMTISMPHLKIKFPTPNGTAVCARDQKAARDAYLEELRGDRVCLVDTEMDSRQAQDAGLEEPTEEVMLDENPEHTTRVGSSLAQELKTQLVDFLRANRDVFAWSPTEMPGIDPEVVMHHLQLNKVQRPVRQRIRHMSMEK